MDIPLVLKSGREGRLVYSIPLWYRLSMIVMAAVLVAAAFASGGAPGPLGWAALVLAILAALYEERWILDPGAGLLRHRFGLLVLARSVALPFDRIEAFRLRSFVRGSVPGSGEEAAIKRDALASADDRGDASAEAKSGRRRHKKTYVSLVCDDLEGGGLVLNILPASRVERLREVGRRLAEASGKSFSEGDD